MCLNTSWCIFFPTQIKSFKVLKACAYLLSLWEYPSVWGLLGVILFVFPESADVICHLAIPTAICFPGEKGRGVLHLQQSGMCGNHIPALVAEQDLLVIGRLDIIVFDCAQSLLEFYLFMKTLTPGLTSWNSCSQWLGFCYPLLNGTRPLVTV